MTFPASLSSTSSLDIVSIVIGIHPAGGKEHREPVLYSTSPNRTRGDGAVFSPQRLGGHLNALRVAPLCRLPQGFFHYCCYAVCRGVLSCSGISMLFIFSSASPFHLTQTLQTQCLAKLVAWSRASWQKPLLDNTEVALVAQGKYLYNFTVGICTPLGGGKGML